MGRSLHSFQFDTPLINYYHIAKQLVGIMANKCPKCQTDNPSDSKFCKVYITSPLKGKILSFSLLTEYSCLKNNTTKVKSI